MSICEGVEKMKKMEGEKSAHERKNEEEEDVRRFICQKGLRACLACTSLVRNGLFRTGSYHNVLF